MRGSDALAHARAWDPIDLLMVTLGERDDAAVIQ
jgi:hypothetical protein